MFGQIWFGFIITQHRDPFVEIIEEDFLKERSVRMLRVKEEKKKEGGLNEKKEKDETQAIEEKND